MGKQLLLSLLFVLSLQIRAQSITDITGQVGCLSVTIKQICPNSNVTFWLYNPNVQDYQLNENNISTITKAPFKQGVKTVMILHGFTKSKSEEVNVLLRPEYMKKGYNIISVDYSKVVPRPCYAQAVANSDRIAKCTANFVKILLSNTTVTLDKFIVIGFSLGGQIAGRTGTYLRRDSKTLHRLIGLDVAGPLFYGPATYINQRSAKFVIAIHTNAILFGKLGFVGNVDFFVNEGLVQSHCLGTVDVFNITQFINCSHIMAPQYYAESIAPSNPTKVFCGRAPLLKPIVMGEYTPDGSAGVYHVVTNLSPPYAKDDVCE